MQQERPRLRLRLSVPDQDPAEARLALAASAIRNKVSLKARYNGQTILIAPQILFSRNGGPHLDAVVLERDGQRDEELRLRTFNLSGLHDLKTSGLHFELQPIDLGEEKYARDDVKIIAFAGGEIPEARAVPLHCSSERPWGIHPRLDESGACPRCGWRAERVRAEAAPA